jgi:hypothetical protein
VKPTGFARLRRLHRPAHGLAEADESKPASAYLASPSKLFVKYALGAFGASTSPVDFKS